ncbi:wax ester/triacylglycerol synthase domain-containing protein [Calidifontibacter indicus]|uniref:Wax ester synthase-like acyl-CoA acyltransferase family protein n=1 Tax=Calidifontibacter indicus TaxID=419650 RepID=A0A3D9UIZ2_9MICO|nr:wax ester/triacylglycerol synthase domain-containing protein [Calidifontibacter indicus]REF29289.1 wax ester synthase-like acyl-CoA acyltransferase family protein [Calidifontibacter indicus]
MTSQALPDDFAPMPLTVQDQLWLDMDRPNNLMVIDSLIWLAQSPDWDAIRATIQERMVDRYPVFRCRPEHIRGRTHWARDPQFRLSRHVRKAGLRGPVDEERVREYVSGERSKPFASATCVTPSAPRAGPPPRWANSPPAPSPRWPPSPATRSVPSTS